MSNKAISLPSEKCIGCGICASACPKEAIEMLYDSEGFIRPIINDKCIECGRCEKICTVNNNSEVNNSFSKQSLACYTTNQEDHFMCSSGGIFAALAKEVIENGGAVFGATYDHDGNIYHICVDSTDKLHTVYGSKYAQSDISNILSQIDFQIKNNREILFVGTPCQVKAIKTLYPDCENLHLVDFFCHGVGSNSVFKLYLKKRLRGKNADYISFRDKSRSYRAYRIAFKSGKTEYSNHHLNDLFMRAYLENLILRPSCYKCEYHDSVSDITLGDYFDCPHLTNKDQYDLGVSRVVINNSNGEKLFDRIKDKAVCNVINADAVYNRQSRINPNRERFFSELKESGEICSLLKKYTSKATIKAKLYRRFIAR